MASASSELAILIKATDDASQHLKTIADNTENIGVKAGLASAAFTAAFGLIEKGVEAVAGGFAATIGSAADFESKMSAIKAVTGASSEEMEALSKVALQLGKDTSFSAGEAAIGIGELVKGGVSVADIMGGAAAAALNLAAAGGVDLGTAAAIAANAMAEFNLTGEQTANVADKIAGFANATTGSVEDFKFSLQSVGAVAALAGQSFDDTATAIALMGKAGILGSDAGTSLKTMLINLQPQTENARDAFRQLGLYTVDTEAAMSQMTQLIESHGAPGLKLLADKAKDGALTGADLYASLKKLGDPIVQGASNFNELAEKLGLTTNKFVDAEGHFVSMREVAQALKEGVSNLTDAEATMALKMAFGTDAIRAAAIMAKEGADGFDDMVEAMSHVTAADVAATRLDNLKGSMEQFSGSAETVAIIFGTAFLPVLREAVDTGTQFLNDVVMPWAEENGPAMAETAGQVVHVFLDFLHVVGDVIGAMGGLPGVIQAASGPISLLAGFIAAGATAFVLWEAGAIAAAVATNGMAVAQGILNVVMAANPIGLIVVALAGLTAALVVAYNTNEDFRNAVDAAWSTIQAVAEAVFPAIGEAIDAAIEVIGNMIVAVVRMPQDVGDAFDALGTIVHDTMESVHKTITDVWDQIPADIRADLELIAGVLLDRFNGFVTMITGKNDEIQGNTVGMWSDLVGQVGGKANEIKEFVGNAFDQLGTTVRAAWDAVVANILAPLADAVAGVLKWVGDVLGALGSLRDQAVATALAIGADIVSSLISGIGSGVENLKKAAWDMARAALQSAKDALDQHSPSKEFQAVGKDIPDSTALGVDEGTPELLAKVRKLYGDVVLESKEGMSEKLPELKRFGTDVLVPEIMEAITPTAQQLSALRDAYTGPQGLSGIVIQAMTNIETEVVTTIPAITSAWNQWAVNIGHTNEALTTSFSTVVNGLVGVGNTFGNILPRIADTTDYLADLESAFDGTDESLEAIINPLAELESGFDGLDHSLDQIAVDITDFNGALDANKTKLQDVRQYAEAVVNAFKTFPTSWTFNVSGTGSGATGSTSNFPGYPTGTVNNQNPVNTTNNPAAVGYTSQGAVGGTNPTLSWNLSNAMGPANIDTGGGYGWGAIPGLGQVRAFVPGTVAGSQPSEAAPAGWEWKQQNGVFYQVPIQGYNPWGSTGPVGPQAAVAPQAGLISSLYNQINYATAGIVPGVDLSSMSAADRASLLQQMIGTGLSGIQAIAGNTGGNPLDIQAAQEALARIRLNWPSLLTGTGASAASAGIGGFSMAGGGSQAMLAALGMFDGGGAPGGGNPGLGGMLGTRGGDILTDMPMGPMGIALDPTLLSLVNDFNRLYSQGSYFGAMSAFNKLATAGLDPGTLGYYRTLLARMSTTMSNVPAMAGGGIAMAPTLALIGERGPEAIVPLGANGPVAGAIDYDRLGDAVVRALHRAPPVVEISQSALFREITRGQRDGNLVTVR